MAVLALNQRQPLAGTQFVATFSGVAIDDVLVISLEDVDIVFDESANIPFLDLVSRTNGEVRVHVLTEKVQAEVNTFSFQIRASASLNRSWVLNNPNSQESYQVYATTISAGKTLELLEFSREGEGWAIRSANQTIGEVAPPADELVYPEHLRDLALASRGASAAGWGQVHAFVEVNETSMPHLGSQLYLDTLAATQAISASTKVAPLTISYGTFGDITVPLESRVDEAHRAQLKALTAASYASGTPSSEQLRGRVAQLAPGGALIAMVTTLGGFDIDGMLELLESRDAHLMLLSMRSVAFGIVPHLGGSSRLQGFAVANLESTTPRSVVELLRSKN
jgi:hypothetical protein